MNGWLKQISWRTGQLTTLTGVLLTFAQIAVRQGVSSEFTLAMSHLFRESSFNVWFTIAMLILVSGFLLYFGRSTHTPTHDKTSFIAPASRTAHLR